MSGSFLKIEGADWKLNLGALRAGSIFRASTSHIADGPQDTTKAGFNFILLEAE